MQSKTKPTRETVNSWVWTGQAPGIHLPKLSLGPIFIDYDLATKLQLKGSIRVPADVDSVELAVIYWRHAAGAVHTINLDEGDHAVDGEYLRASSSLSNHSSLGCINRDRTLYSEEWRICRPFRISNGESIPSNRQAWIQIS